MKRFVPLILLFIWITFVYILYRPNMYSIRFGDEEDNFLLGKYVLQGEKLYSDLFSHHQPFAYVLSSGVQLLTQPTSIITLVRHHREFMFAWALVWTGAAIVIFGVPALVFSLAYEFPKRYFFGDEFLSESLAVYPLIFILLFLLENEKLNSKLKVFLIGLSFAICALLLMPIWPALAFIFLVLLVKLLKHWQYFLGGVILATVSVIPFVSIEKYIYNCFYINNTYYIPFGNSIGEGTSLKGFITPLLAFISPGPTNEILFLIRILSLAFVFMVCFLIFKKRYYQAVFLAVTLGLIGLRYSDPGKVFYQGFHMLPWFAVIILFSTHLSWKYFKPLAIIILFSSIFLTRNEIFRRSDPARDFHINYSRSFDTAQAINTLGSTTDNLFATPGDWLVYWQAKTKHASYMLNYYGWMVRVPSIKNETERTLTQVPTFFYCTDDCLTMGLRPYLDNYQELFRDGSQTGIFVKPSVLSNLTEAQKKQLTYYRYTTK